MMFCSYRMRQQNAKFRQVLIHTIGMPSIYTGDITYERITMCSWAFIHCMSSETSLARPGDWRNPSTASRLKVMNSLHLLGVVS